MTYVKMDLHFERQQKGNSFLIFKEGKIIFSFSERYRFKYEWNGVPILFYPYLSLNSSRRRLEDLKN